MSSTPEPGAYPPARHILRDLAPRIERQAGETTLLQPIADSLLDASGAIRAGVLAMDVDVLAGDVALRGVHPNWVATSGLSLQLDRAPGSGTIRLRPRALRQGRTTSVVEVALEHVESGAPVGLSTTSFSVLPSREGFQRQTHWIDHPEPVVAFGGDAPDFDCPIAEAIGIRGDVADPAFTALDRVDDYVVNSLGALQGGVAAILLDAAAERFAAAAIGGPARLRHLEIHYLKLGRVGPIRATTREVATLSGGARLLRVELRDAGRDDVLLSVANGVADPA